MKVDEMRCLPKINIYIYIYTNRLEFRDDFWTSECNNLPLGPIDVANPDLDFIDFATFNGRCPECHSHLSDIERKAQAFFRALV